jgi:hypothetical protein
MSLRVDRSMNHELVRGTVDGTIRMLRPNSSNAEYKFAQNRAAMLHVLHYGSQGIAGENSPRIAEVNPFVDMPSGYGPERYTKRR